MPLFIREAGVESPLGGRSLDLESLELLGELGGEKILYLLLD